MSTPGLTVSLRQLAPIPLDVAFYCAPGELMALVGPSGSGKSTILRAIAGLYRAAEARITVNGTTWEDTSPARFLPPWERHVGFVFQDYALFPHMSARANVESALGDIPRDRRRPRADELLALVKLAGLEERRPAELSGGQKQRVALARALAREPAVLLLDEPFSAVDKVTRGRLYLELASIRDRLRMPIILVTHDLDEALMLSDTMCVLQRGRILQSGPPLDLLQRPASVETARLVGHRNIFPGRVVLQGAVTVLDWRGLQLEAAPSPSWKPGDQISWLIPPSKVLLHRRDRPSQGNAENPVTGTITSFAALGDNTISTVRIDGGENRELTVHVPRHVADRNHLGVGERIAVSLLGEAIHVMPMAVPRRRSRDGTSEANLRDRDAQSDSRVS